MVLQWCDSNWKIGMCRLLLCRCQDFEQRPESDIWTGWKECTDTYVDSKLELFKCVLLNQKTYTVRWCRWWNLTGLFIKFPEIYGFSNPLKFPRSWHWLFYNGDWLVYTTDIRCSSPKFLGFLFPRLQCFQICLWSVHILLFPVVISSFFKKSLAIFHTVIPLVGMWDLVERG